MTRLARTMQAATLARSVRILLALALLGAQQLALSHQIWHFGKQGPQPAQEQLCGQHDALGAVAGALDAPAVPFALEAPDEPACAGFAPSPAATPRLAPRSQGPPSLL